MKVWEFRNILADEHDYTLIDNETCEEILEEVDTDLYDDCEVLEVRGHTCDTIALYINRPSEQYETWLDVTYSIKIVADVPAGTDRNEFMKKIAEEEMSKLPKTLSFSVGGTVWSITDDNMQSGSFYDLIERC